MQTDSHIEVVSPDRYYAYSRHTARLQNDLYCVEWGVKLYSNHPDIQKEFSVIVNHRVKRG